MIDLAGGALQSRTGTSDALAPVIKSINDVLFRQREMELCSNDGLGSSCVVFLACLVYLFYLFSKIPMQLFFWR